MQRSDENPGDQNYSDLSPECACALGSAPCAQALSLARHPFSDIAVDQLACYLKAFDPTMGLNARGFVWDANGDFIGGVRNANEWARQTYDLSTDLIAFFGTLETIIERSRSFLRKAKLELEQSQLDDSEKQRRTDYVLRWLKGIFSRTSAGIRLGARLLDALET